MVKKNKQEIEQTTALAADVAAVPEETVAGVAAESSAAVKPVTDSFGQPLVLPLEEMDSAARFAATKRLLFVAPDVPPVPPRPRRNNDLRRFDELFERSLKQERDAERRSSRDSKEYDNIAERDERAAEQPRAARGKTQDKNNAAAEPQKVKGSTRLEAKKQRRRDSRETTRRRSVVTESEFLARREAVDRVMVVSTKSDRVQIGVLEDKVLVEHYVARSTEASLIGNVYLGKVQNVLPSMEAAFVDIGHGRNAVLYSGEVDWSDYTGSNSSRKIEKVLSPGDTVLVQVTKDPVGQKGARLTSQISLPGRFLVYVPGGAMNGISRKLPDTERARLKKILKQNVPDGAGVIVRTAAEGASEQQLAWDVEHLTKLWESISARANKGNGPALLHAEPDMLIKIVRDVFNEDFQEMIVEGEETYQTIVNYLQQVAPDLLERIKPYEGEREVFDKYRVTEQIQKALERKVWLPSGGSLVIDRTEAMTVIDVNTGKFVGSGGNLEETVTKNNLEAAEEIVRQLRLRDSGGIIVIDFIDMVLESNRDLVLRRLIECLGRDRTKHQVAEVTSLGLVQMTRKKLGLGLLESFSENCDTCDGRGVVVQQEPVTNRKPEPQQKRRRKQQQEKQQQRPLAITDDAKNMIAQVAASTVSTADSSGDNAAASGAVTGGADSSGDSGAGTAELRSSGAASQEVATVAVAEQKTSAKTRKTVGRKTASSTVATDTAADFTADAVGAAVEQAGVGEVAAPSAVDPGTVESSSVTNVAAVAGAPTTETVSTSTAGGSRRVSTKMENSAARQADDAVAAVKAAQQKQAAGGAQAVESAGVGAVTPAGREVSGGGDDPQQELAAAVRSAAKTRRRIVAPQQGDGAVQPQEALDLLTAALDSKAAQVHPSEPKRSRDGGAEELMKKHGDQADKLAGLFDVLGALPEPPAPGKGRGRAEKEERLKQRTTGSRRVRREQQ
ncbi:ribonuclease E [Canibacter oris]|uniref:Ribonuclease E n=1 Tax=Canibacter oris TaxID=1365628 RepID=A0A840DCJ5_9MICO|nr:ribonuclease E [Canibacter oris]